MTRNASTAPVLLVPTDPFAFLSEERLARWAEREHAVCTAGGTRLPNETLEEIRSARLLCAPVPSALGGRDADLSCTTRAVRRVAQRAPCTALALTMPLGNAANTRLGDESVPAAQRAALASGRTFIAERAVAGDILAVANSEPGSGGDMLNTRTRAVRGRDGIVRLTGRKSFATLGPDADYFLCAARTEEGLLDAFFVAKGAPGLTLAEDWNALGMRATASVGLTLAETPAAAPFLYPGAIGSVCARHWSTLLMAAIFVGIGEGAVMAATDSVPRSSTWARATLADCTLTLDAARAFVEAVAREDMLPCSASYVERCRRAKTFAARTAVEVTTRCMMIAGGRAYRPEHALARALLDAVAGPLLRPPLPQAMDAIACDVLGPA